VILGANDGGARRSSCSPTLLGRGHHLACAHAFRTRRLDRKCGSSDHRCGPQRPSCGLGVGGERLSTRHRRLASSDGCHRRDGRLPTGLSGWHHHLQPRIVRMHLRAFAADAGIRPRHSGGRCRRNHESERGAVRFTYPSKGGVPVRRGLHRPTIPTFFIADSVAPKSKVLLQNHYPAQPSAVGP
jgi:hypothetical protein